MDKQVKEILIELAEGIAMVSNEVRALNPDADQDYSGDVADKMYDLMRKLEEIK